MAQAGDKAQQASFTVKNSNSIRAINFLTTSYFVKLKKPNLLILVLFFEKNGSKYLIYSTEVVLLRPIS